MTKREFYDAIARGTMNEDLQNYAIMELTAMDKVNAKRRTTPSKAQIANVELANTVLDYLRADTEYTTAQIVELGIEGIANSSKASAVLKTLVEMGKLSVENGTATYTNKDGKLCKRKGVNIYTLIEN